MVVTLCVRVRVYRVSRRTRKRNAVSSPSPSPSSRAASGGGGRSPNVVAHVDGARVPELVPVHRGGPRLGFVPGDFGRGAHAQHDAPCAAQVAPQQPGERGGLLQAAVQHQRHDGDDLRRGEPGAVSRARGA